VAEPTTAPVTAEGLRERVQVAWNDSEDWCARCHHCDTQLDAILATLADDPGDLPARMAEAIVRYFADPPFDVDLPSLWRGAAEVALSVRWEHAAAQAVEVERLRAELAEEEYQKGRWISDAAAHDRRVSELERDLEEARRTAESALAGEQERGKSWAEKVIRVQAERDALKAAIERVRVLAKATKPGGSIPPADCTNTCFHDACDCSGSWRPTSWKLNPVDVLAALDAPETPGDADTPDAPTGGED
jgi:hypothetical protein